MWKLKLYLNNKLVGIYEGSQMECIYAAIDDGIIYDRWSLCKE